MQVIIEQGESTTRYKREKDRMKNFPQHLQVLQDRQGKNNCYLEPGLKGKMTKSTGRMTMEETLERYIDELKNSGMYQNDKTS